MNTFRFPQPGERQNASAIPVSVEVLANVVTLAVQAIDSLGCDDAACPDCGNSRESCMRAFSLLPPRQRDLVDKWLLRESHINPGDWRR